MHKTTRLFLTLAFTGYASLFAACSKSTKGSGTPIAEGDPAADPTAPAVSPADEKAIEALSDRGLTARVSVLIDPAKYAEAMVKVEAYEQQGLLRVLYNPNQSKTEVDAAPFLIVELSPDLFQDIGIAEFLGLLNFDAMALDREFKVAVPKSDKQKTLEAGYLPVDAIQGRALGTTGKGVTVAVLDTGIDMGHPFLANGPAGDEKIVDFADLTQELDFELVETDAATALAAFKKAGIELAATTKFEETKIEEKRLRGIRAVEIDLNGDGEASKVYPALVASVLDSSGKVLNGYIAVDVDGDGSYAKSEIVEAFQRGKRAQLLALGDGRNRGLRKVALKRLEGWGKEKPLLTLGLDIAGHGTHVSGIIAGYQKGAALRGMAPDARLMNVRVLNSGGSGSFSNIYAGLVYAAQNGADIVNMSLGGGQRPDQDAVAPKLARFLSQRYGMLIVAAAGNDGPTLNTGGDPGNFETILTVGAYNPIESLKANLGDTTLDQGTFFYWSSRGPTANGLPKPDVVAPGGVISSVPQAGATNPIAYMNGTSMAAPMVAGGAAVLLERALKADLKLLAKDRHGSVSQRPLALKRALQEGAKPQDGFQVVDQGYGLVQLEASFGALAKWDTVFTAIKKEDPDYRLFRYLTFGGHFTEALKSDTGVKAVTITAVDDVSIPRVKDRIDENAGLDVEAKASWIELTNALGQKVGSKIGSLQPFTRNNAFGYELNAANRRDGSMDNAWIDLKDSRTGVSQGRILVVDYHPITLTAEPTLLDDGVTEVAYVHRLPEVSLRATGIRRFFVRVPPGATSLGIRTRALGRGTGHEPVAIGVFASDFASRLAEDTENLMVRNGRSTVTEDFVNVPVGARGIVEVVVYGFAAVKESRFAMEFRATGLKAQPMAMLSATANTVTVGANDALERPNAKATATASPWMVIEPLTPASAEATGVEVGAGEIVYYPVALSGEMNVLVKPIGPSGPVDPEKIEFDFELLNADLGALKEGVDFSRSERGFYVFAKETVGFVAIAGVVHATPSLKFEVSAVRVTDAKPTVAVATAGTEFSATVTQSAPLPGLAVSLLDWRDPFAGKDPAARTMLFYLPSSPAESGAPGTESMKKIGESVLKMLDRRSSTEQD